MMKGTIMALKHAKSGEMIDLTTLTKDKSIALVKHTRFEVMRVSLSVRIRCRAQSRCNV